MCQYIDISIAICQYLNSLNIPINQIYIYLFIHYIIYFISISDQYTNLPLYQYIPIYPYINFPYINQSTNQSINQSISQSINLSIHQSSNQSKKVSLFFSSSSSSVFLRPLSPFPPLPPPPSHAPPPLHRRHGRHHDHHHHHGHHDHNDLYDHRLIVTISITITITCTVMNVSHLSPSSLNAVAFFGQYHCLFLQFASLCKDSSEQISAQLAFVPCTWLRQLLLLHAIALSSSPATRAPRN